MNTWITDHLLRTEEENRNSIINDFAAAERRTRHTEGWVTGYSIKTKLFKSKVDESEDVECNINAMDNDIENNTTSNEGDQNTTEAPQDDQTSNFDDDNMCTICLLAVEDNERVADLSCGHLYHAECLGEWVLKKVCRDHMFNLLVELLSYITLCSSRHNPLLVEFMPFMSGPRHCQRNKIIRRRIR